MLGKKTKEDGYSEVDCDGRHYGPDFHQHVLQGAGVK